MVCILCEIKMNKNDFKRLYDFIYFNKHKLCIQIQIIYTNNSPIGL